MSNETKIDELNSEFRLRSDFGRKVPFDAGHGVVLAEIDLGETLGKLKIRAGDASVVNATMAFESAGLIAKKDNGDYKLVLG